MASPLGHSQVLDDDCSSATNSRIIYSESKISPSEIPAEELSITCIGVLGTFTVNRGLTAKIYFQKKHFLWEYSDAADTAEKRRKRKIEIKFQDIRRMYVVAKEGTQGKIVIGRTYAETTLPLTLYKEKIPPVKSTQWDKATNDFTNGFSSPREGSCLTITTTIGKDIMTKRVAGKPSHLDKLLSSDQRLKKFIENDPSTSHDTVKPRQVRDSLTERPEVGEEHYTDPSLIFSAPDSINAMLPQEATSNGHSVPFSSLSSQDLVETCAKTFRPKKLPSSSLSKYRFRCPAPKCSAKFISDGPLREHLYQRHRSIVDMGLTVTESGNFVVSPNLLISVLA
jgi:hypothetical protein